MHTVVCEQNHQGSLLQPYSRHANRHRPVHRNTKSGWLAAHVCVCVWKLETGLIWWIFVWNYPCILLHGSVPFFFLPVCKTECVCLIHWTGYWSWQYGIQLIPPATPLTWLNNHWFNASQCVHRCVYTSIC